MKRNYLDYVFYILKHKDSGGANIPEIDWIEKEAERKQLLSGIPVTLYTQPRYVTYDERRREYRNCLIDATEQLVRSRDPTTQVGIEGIFTQTALLIAPEWLV